MIIRTSLSLLLGMAFGSTLLAADEFVTLVVGGKGSPVPPMMRPPGDTGVAGADVIGHNFQKLGTSIVDKGGESCTKRGYRKGDWTLEVESCTPRGATRIERGFTVGYHGSGEVLLRCLEVALPAVGTREDDLVELKVSSVPYCRSIY